IGFAFHLAHDTHGKLPPGVGWYTSSSWGGYGIVFFHLLPFLEEGALYRRSYTNGSYLARNDQVYAQPVKTYVCPSDPSTGRGGVATDNQGIAWGARSYAGSAQVFCQTDAQGDLLDPFAEPRIPASIPDGTSNTILVAEKYARCTNSFYKEGGSFWAYDVVGPTAEVLHPGFLVSWNGYATGPGSKFVVRP